MASNDITVSGNTRAQLERMRGPHDAGVEETAFTVGAGDPAAVPPGAQYFFPAKYMRTTPEDDRIALKRTLAEHRYLGDARLEQKDINWIMRKKAEAEEYNLDRWFASQFNFADPIELKQAQEMHPHYFERMEKRMDTWFDLAKRVGRINLRGIKNREDMMLAYAINRGVIKLPPPRFWMPGMQVDGGADKRLLKGLWNPSRFRDPTAQRQLGALAFGEHQANAQVQFQAGTDANFANFAGIFSDAARGPDIQQMFGRQDAVAANVPGVLDTPARVAVGRDRWGTGA